MTKKLVNSSRKICIENLKTYNINDNENKEYELDSFNSAFVHMYEEKQWFHEAFITEIGVDITKTISFRELLDIFICSGKDVTSLDLHRIWPYDTGKSNSDLNYDG